ncbi:MAG TPA: DbpA RNA binding domain-containing protein, partial [Longimicrobiales bacterium]|nr:DbpA RNA binding domain-containing protein [Longimicrobiales bacterium]
MSPQLADNAGSAGYDTPTELQRSAIPVLRRGNNAIITASPGAGATAAYALALLDRFADAESPRALVIAPSSERAHQIARTIGQLASGTTGRVASLGEGWRNPATAGIVVATPRRLQRAMGSSELNFESVEAVVVDQADIIQTLGDADALSEVFAALPREGQRVFVGSSFTGGMEKIVESHARKALHFPPRPAIDEVRSDTPTIIGTVRYAVAQSGAKLEVLARLVGSQRDTVRVLCRSTRAVDVVSRELEMRGFDAEVTTFAVAVDNYAGRTYAYDVPATAEQLGYLQDGDVIICTPAEIAHVRRVAQTGNVDLTALRDRSTGDEALESFREEVREAAREEDLSAQLLVLQPLFDDMSPAEVAAALSALLRSKRPQRAEQAVAGAAKGQKTWSRLFISIGERDDVTARDIVGAITGEASLSGGDVGKVEVRDTFSVIEVASTAADRVIKALNGTTMKGRSLRVDYDRKSAGGGERQPRNDRPPRSERSPRGD